jgi:hypothetical protein
MMMEKLMNWLAREIELVGGNLPQCRGGKPETNRLSYGTASVHALDRVATVIGDSYYLSSLNKGCTES